MNKTTVIQTKKITEIRLNKQDLISIIKARITNLGKDFDIYMHVPGGGDWSNTNLFVDDDTPLIVVSEELTTKTE